MLGSRLWQFSKLEFRPQSVGTVLLDLDSRYVTVISGRVQQMQDRSGNGYHATAPTADNRPIFVPSQAGYGGKPALNFQATPDTVDAHYLDTPDALGVAINNGPVTILVVGHVLNANGSNNYFVMTKGGSELGLFAAASADWSPYAAGVFPSSGESPTVASLVTTVFNGALSAFFHNSIVPDSSDFSAIPGALGITQGLRIGNWQAADPLYAAGGVILRVIVWQGALTTLQVEKAMKGMSALYGVTITSLSPAPTVSAVSPNVGDPAGGGAAITITGTDFVSGGGLGVTIGGNPCTSVTWVNSTTLTCIPPSGTTGVKNVVVTNPDAQTSGASGNGLWEYFSPLDLSPTCALLPGNYSVTGTQGVDAVGTWTDSSGNANHAVSSGGVSAPAALAGCPDFVAADLLHLVISRSLASVTGSPPDMATLTAGTEIVCFEADLSSGAPGANYEDSVLAVGSGASAGLCYNDNGVCFEAYDEVDLTYHRTTEVAAATGVKHFSAGRWNSTTWSCKVNGSAWQNNTNTAGTLSNGNVGPSTELGRSYGGGRYFDGRERLYLVYATALSDANVDKIRTWSQQRGIAA